MSFSIDSLAKLSCLSYLSPHHFVFSNITFSIFALYFLRFVYLFFFVSFSASFIVSFLFCFFLFFIFCLTILYLLCYSLHLCPLFLLSLHLSFFFLSLFLPFSFLSYRTILYFQFYFFHLCLLFLISLYFSLFISTHLSHLFAIFMPFYQIYLNKFNYICYFSNIPDTSCLTFNNVISLIIFMVAF